MSLPASNYTPPGGYVPQAAQVAAGQPNASNTQAPPNTGSMMTQLSSGQELDPTQLSALTGAYGNAATQLGDMQTSDARGTYVNNSNIPAMQSNYEDLARKLFDYDSGTLVPQFQGQSGGTPSDAATFGRVDSSPLAMTVGSAGAPASQGLAITGSNPKYAYSSQIDQGNDIVSLLDTLNKSIGQEFSQRAGTYKNTVDKQQTLLKAISDILNQNRETSLTNKQINAENARAAASLAQEKQLKLMDLGYIDPLTGGLYTDNSGKPSFKSPQEYADSFIGGYTKWNEIPQSMKIAVTKIVKQEGGDVNKLNAAQKSIDDGIAIANNINSKWQKLNPVEKLLPGALGSHLSPGRASINAMFFGSLEPSLRNAVVAGRITQQEINWLRDAFLPGSLDTPDAAKAKLDAFIYGMQMKQKNPNYVIGDDTIREMDSGNPQQNTSENTKSYNGVTYVKVNGGWKKQ